MPMTDPISDMLTRLRNAQAQNHKTVRVPASNMKKAILEVLQSEGYILGYSVEESDKVQKAYVVELKYHQGQPVISKIARISKPGRRMYSPAQEIPMVANGLGVTIVSTSRGVMTDTKARELNVGGEILCQVL